MTIEHVIVLMLENRSFDCLLGALYPASPAFHGLTGAEKNTYAGQPVPVWKSKGSALDDTTARIPDPDPGELFTDMNQQLFGDGPQTAPPTMSGFVANYMAQPNGGKLFDPGAVMHYFTPEQVPVISTLAKAFGVSDQWYASAPCQTWPNRFFAHTGTALGCVNNHQFQVPFPAPSIFRKLQDNGKTWRVYFHDIPQSLLLRDVWLSAVLHYRFFDQFLADAASDALPNYAFIEPRYFPDAIFWRIQNDEHPPHNVQFGERLIARVYNALRKSKGWEKSLLIITCDEHGGCFDHVPPPGAVPPDAHNENDFNFDRYGVRVPAVLVSPFIPAGSIIRAAPQGLPAKGPPYPFDHTSILSTLRKLFNLGLPLTARDAVAPDLLEHLSLDAATNDGPPAVPEDAVPYVSTKTVAEHADAPPNHMQTSLARMAASLPIKAPTDVAPPPRPMQFRQPPNAATALAEASARVRSFLNIDGVNRLTDEQSIAGPGE